MRWSTAGTASERSQAPPAREDSRPETAGACRPVTKGLPTTAGSPRGDAVAGTPPGVMTQPAGGRLAAAAVRTLDADAAARLPVAGLGLIGLALLGLLSLAGGSGLRLAQR